MGGTWRNRDTRGLVGFMKVGTLGARGDVGVRMWGHWGGGDAVGHGDTEGL